MGIKISLPRSCFKPSCCFVAQDFWSRGDRVDDKVGVEVQGWETANTIWTIVAVVYKIIMWYVINELHGSLKKNWLWWRNETYWYLMTWPQINATVSNFYDKFNTWLIYPIGNKIVNIPLSYMFKITKMMSNLTTKYFGDGINELLFPERKGEILRALRFDQSWLKMWYDARLNESWGRPFSAFKRYDDHPASRLSSENRLKTLWDNMQAIQGLKSRESGTASYGLNEFAAMSKQEFMARYCTYYPSNDDHNYHSDDVTYSATAFGSIPDEFDWRSRGLVSGVKRHKLCGGGWAYAVVDCLEVHDAIRKNRSLLTLSEQQIIDCDENSMGCFGGSITNAYKYITEAGGLALNASYPCSEQQGSCYFKPKMAAIKIKDKLYNLPPVEEAIRQFVHNNGPVVSAINCAQLQFYKSGVIRCDHPNCNPNFLNHAVTVIGYGIEQASSFALPGSNVVSGGTPYWLVKNSWGRSWGEKGYFKVFRGENILGIESFMTAPVIEP